MFYFVFISLIFQVLCVIFTEGQIFRTIDMLSVVDSRAEF